MLHAGLNRTINAVHSAPNRAIKCRAQGVVRYVVVVGVSASTKEILSEMRIDMPSGGCGPACPVPREPRSNRETQPTPGH